MPRRDLNYYRTFIAVAADSQAATGTAPQSRGAKQTVAEVQYAMLAARPYTHTQEDVLFETSIRGRPELTDTEKQQLRGQFFAKPQACLRASPLPKKFGWGLHFDAAGTIAL